MQGSAELEQQLQQQQEVLSQPLPNAVHMHILDRFSPKHRAWDGQLLAFQFQKIKTENGWWNGQ
jgi:hypothetical protein